MRILIAFLGLRLALGLSAAPAASVPPELPVETFFRKPTFSSLNFSPDGKALALLETINNRQNLVVLDLVTMKKTLLTNLKDQDVDGFTWVTDNRLVFVLDGEGDEFYGFYVIGRDGKGYRELSGTAKKQIEAGKVQIRSVQIFGHVPSEPDQILVLENSRYANFPDVYRINLRTGGKMMTVLNPGNVGNWIADRAGVVRIGVAYEPDRTEVLYRDTVNDEWTSIHSSGPNDAVWIPIGFDADNRTLYVASSAGRRTVALYRYDTRERKLDPNPVLADDIYDASGIIYSRARNQVLGAVIEKERRQVRWFDPADDRKQAIVDAAFPGYDNAIIDTTPDGNVLLIRSSSDREPGVYFMMSLREKQLKEIAVTRHWIDPDQMATMKPIKYRARDGLEIHGYLTLPAGREPKNLPLIINPHGGPYGIRDRWGFNSEVQFLANRGFAVLQVNYRGSGGYGPDFERIGYKKWGREMQDDLTDAVRWAIDEGYADPGKVVILGGSYGGYAVMAGLAFTPELYRAGVNIVGATDIGILIENSRAWHEVTQAVYARQIADPRTDADYIRDCSPVNHAGRVVAPVFMAYGENDPRVVLKREGKSVEFYFRRDEGHGFRKEENAIELYRRIEAFLKRQLMGKGGP
jgi:dipeptidyl aminopeptidase/acylaminoacyl peptidase